MTLALAGEQRNFFVRGAKTFALGSMSHLDEPEIVENVGFVEEQIDGGLTVLTTF